MERTFKTARFYDELKDVSFIPLETNNDCIIGEISKVLYVKDHYYILDKKFQSLNIFDESGKHIRTAGAVGRGPGEFLSIEDIQIGPDSNSVIALSNNSRKMIIYDLKGGFIKDLTTGLTATDFGVLEDKYYLFINKNRNELSGNYNLFKLSENGTILNKYFELSNAYDESVSFSGFINKNKSGLLFNPSFNDTVFQIEPSKQYAKYIFNFGTSSIPENIKNSNSRTVKASGTYSFLLKTFVDIGNKIVFDYKDKQNKLKTTLIKFGKNSNELTKIDFKFPMASVVGVKKESELISFVFPYYLISDKREKWVLNSIKEYPILDKIIKKLNVEANPILIVYKLK